jgi:hypothetical protein
MLTAFVARTELPQQGQRYFLVLDGFFGVITWIPPLCAPVPGI